MIKASKVLVNKQIQHQIVQAGFNMAIMGYVCRSSFVEDNQPIESADDSLDIHRFGYPLARPFKE